MRATSHVENRHVRSDHAVQDCHRPRAARRPEATACCDALARQGNAERLVARHSARVREGAVQLLGEGLRLARARKAAEPLSAVPHHHRRRRHPLHSRPLTARECAAAGDDARLARFDRRVPESDRAAHRSDEARRQGIRCVPRGVSVAARLRLLRQTDDDRLERREDRSRVERADAATRLQEVRRARRRLGRDRDDRDRSERHRELSRHPSEHADRHARSRDDERPHRSRKIRARRHAALRRLGLRLFEAAEHAAANARLRSRRFAERPGRVDHREVLVVDGLRRPSGEHRHRATSCSTT